MRTITSRLWALVLCSVLALLGVGGVGKWVASVGTVSKVMRALPGVDTIAEMRADAMIVKMSIGAHLVALQTDDKDRVAATINAALKSFLDHAAQYEKNGVFSDKDMNS